MEIFPSIISGDLLHIAQMLKSLDPQVNGYHVDVMDDHFVPNLTWGPAFVNAISQATMLPIHAHLMVSNPFRWLDRLVLKNKDFFIFHYESVQNKFEDIELLIKEIHDRTWHCGIAISPQTDPKRIIPLLSKVDQVLIMSVVPGFSGQEFISEVKAKIPFFVSYKNEKKLSYKLAIDGGVNKNNIESLYALGIEQFSIASAIFAQKDPLKAINSLRIV